MAAAETSETPEAAQERLLQVIEAREKILFLRFPSILSSFKLPLSSF